MSRMARWTHCALVPLVALLCTQLHLTDARSAGALPEACDTMVPGHGVDPQTTPPPYELSVSSQRYSPGEDITVKISSPSASAFKGFLVQARTLDNAEERVGKFTPIATDQQLRCDEQAATHTSSTDKFSVQLRWTPPDSGVGTIRFRGTVVQAFSTFWTEIYSEEITEMRTTTTTTSTTTTTMRPTSTRSMTTITARQFTPANVTHRPGTNSPAPPPSTTTSPREPTGIQIDLSECGVDKGCFVYPEGCRGNNCDMIATWRPPRRDETSMMFELQGRYNGWVGLGFSEDDAMGDDYVLLCLIGTFGDVSAESSYNIGPPFRRTETFDEESFGLSEVMTSNEDGVITCVFKRELDISTVAADPEGENRDKFYDIRQQYTLFLGGGAATLGFPNQHISIPQISESQLRVASDVGGAGVRPPMPPSSATSLTYSTVLSLVYCFIKLVY